MSMCIYIHIYVYESQYIHNKHSVYAFVEIHRQKNRRNIHGDTEATSRLRITLPFVAWHGTEPTTMGLYTHLNHAQLPNAEAAGQ